MSKLARGCNIFWENIIKQDGLVNNSDGTVSAFADNGKVKAPRHITQQCCGILGLYTGGNYTYDLDTQKCMWSDKVVNGCNENIAVEPIKIVLNTKGNDGSIFYTKEDDTCSLTVSFDYLFKLDCAELTKTIKPKNTPQPNGFDDIVNPKEVFKLENQITIKTAECEKITSALLFAEGQVETLRHSIFCEETPKIDSIYGFNEEDSFGRKTNKSSGFTKEPFTKTGFGSGILPFSIQKLVPITEKNNLCLTEPYGLDKWAQLLGPNKFQAFLDSDSSSFDCSDVSNMIKANDYNYQVVDNGEILLYKCDTPFGTKSEAIKQVTILTELQRKCREELSALIALYDKLTAVPEFINCNSPINVLESLKGSMSIDIVESNGNLTSVYEYEFFPSIGEGNLYNYLLTNNNNGFYICGEPTKTETNFGSCSPLIMTSFKSKPILSNSLGFAKNTTSCTTLNKNLYSGLYEESGLKEQINGKKSFNDSLKPNVFNSTWSSYSMVINDIEIINKLRNKKIKISLKIDNACTDICVLIDQITLKKDCTIIEKETSMFSKSPGFELKRVIDNKKAWFEEDVREYSIYNAIGTDTIRPTDYEVNDERLVINTKEVDLDMNIARGIEQDVWTTIVNNLDMLIGYNECGECDECCGDRINYEELTNFQIKETTTKEKVKEFIITELIDVKNRKTITSYPTMKALYDRYLNLPNSSKYNYVTMGVFSDLVGDYWVDLIEQVIPSTTLWGSVKILTNTVFDQQKFIYKSYSLIICDETLNGKVTASPIVTEPTVGVEIRYTSINKSDDIQLSDRRYNICNSPSIYQMNAGSEFIGEVKIINKNENIQNAQ